MFANIFNETFAESITAEKRRKKLTSYTNDDEGTSPDRIIFFRILLIFGMGLLIAKLFTLTILEGSRYRQLAAENRLREVKITAARGIIYDRNNIPLVRNIPLFIDEHGSQFFEEKPASVSGQLREDLTRGYPFDSAFAHVLGYTGEISQEEIVSERDKFKYAAADMVGKMGIEQSYDTLLRGKDGREVYEVDALGQIVRVLGRFEPTAGNNLKLTLDAKLQQIAASELTGKKGAVIATIPTTGEIVTLYSSPSFDPNRFIRGENVEGILRSMDQPLFNRAIAGLYAPGSTFKIVVALAGLENNIITPQTVFEDTGILKVGDFSFGNWYFLQYGKKDGMVDIVKALQRSNDIFFYKAGEAIGIDKLADFGRKVGIGKPFGLDIKGEEVGVMPDRAWVQKVRQSEWFLGNTYHVSIGQGDLLVTPLNVNSWTNIIASGGKLCRPHLLSNLSDLSNLCKSLEIKKENLELVKEGMKKACENGGTGWPLFNFKVENPGLHPDGVDFLETIESTTSARKMVEIKTACKTGTAEFGDSKKTHAWFTVFAPVIKPQISITVLVEGGGEGSSVAAPIAKKLLEEWFGR